MLVLNLPIEPMENRYSIQWDGWFTEAFKRNEIESIRIPGALISGVVRNGDFNDPIQSWSYKFQQLQKTVGHIMFRDDPIVIFLQDGWFPGQECFKYIKALGNRNIKVAAFWHAGSYLGTDILNEHNCDAWSKLSEKSWARAVDKIFVGSEYHKEKMLRGLQMFDNEKVIVTGCPVDVPNKYQFLSQHHPYKRIVVWPHRPSSGKNPEQFDKLTDVLKAEPEFKEVEFIKSFDVCETKMEFYTLLARSSVAVSTATHETFGISMVEATMLGCRPVVPHRLSYPEIFGQGWTYHTFEEMCAKVRTWLRSVYGYDESYLYKAFNPITVTDKICKEIKGMFT